MVNDEQEGECERGTFASQSETSSTANCGGADPTQFCEKSSATMIIWSKITGMISF